MTYQYNERTRVRPFPEARKAAMMAEIDGLLRRAAIRLLGVRFVRAVVVAVGLGVGLLVVLRIAERLLALSVDWAGVWLGVLGVALLGAAAWVVVMRPDRLGVAREIDERADLRESLGTALCVMDRSDGWSRATVEHARGVSRRVVVRQLFPFSLHRSWPAPVAGAVLFLLLGLLPQADLLSLLETAEAREQEQQEVATAKEQVEAAEKEVREALKGLDVDGLDETLDEDEELAAKTPDEIRRNTIKQLTTMQDRLSDLQNSEKAKGLDDLTDRMRQLRQPEGGPGELDEMVKAMQRGDFESASKALEEMAKKLAQGDLTDAQKKALAEQMKKLGEQMKALAQQREALEKKLEEMGLDKSLAGDPEALRKALENSQELTEAQKEQLREMAQACQNASTMCRGMAGACGSAAMSLAQGGSGLEGLDALAEQLSAAEMLRQEMAGLSAAQAMINKQLAGLGQCMGGGEADMMDIYKRWVQTSPGRGSGQRGIGGGKAPDPKAADYQLNPDRAKTKFDPDTPIIGEMMVRGEQLRGEASQEFREAVRASSEAASEAIETKVIPREYHDAIKHYFGRLEGEPGEGAAGEPAEEKPDETSSDG